MNKITILAIGDIVGENALNYIEDSLSALKK